MRLFIAEKPSLARAIAEALPGPRQNHRDHIVCGGGNVVAWCAGHILEPAPPDAYGERYRFWRLADLPIVPDTWQLRPTAAPLLRTIERLFARADRVVHAGDPDREGQLLVGEVLAFLGYRGPVDRLLVSDLTPAAVARQIAAIEPNAKYEPLYQAALARQKADWLFGMNLSRLYTLLARAGGYDGVVSVGRVQTPLLGLLVARDRAIANFRPVAHHVVQAELRPETAGGTFLATWVPGVSASAFLDEERRLLRRELAEAVAEAAAGKTATVTARKDEARTEAPPLPYSLATLQMDAGRTLGLSAQEVLDIAQRLYETHRLLTYPRSDCAHLPEGHLVQAPEVLSAITKHAHGLASATAAADLSRRSKAWNDKKVTAHHAIIPTPSAASPTPALSEHERAVYELVCRRYIAQFYAPHAYVHTKLELEIAGEAFVATGRLVTTVGWKVLVQSASAIESGGDGPSKDDPQSLHPLPPLSQGDRARVLRAEVQDKKTEPPKAFTDASLIAAMCAVANFVTDPSAKKILTEADGIGTPATRAAIIETLLARGFAVRSGKSILSTETGRALIRALPPVATTPDMTAVWEAAMRRIESRELGLGEFVARITSELGALVAQGQRLGRIVLPPRAAKPASHPKPVGKRRRSTPRRAMRPTSQGSHVAR